MIDRAERVEVLMKERVEGSWRARPLVIALAMALVGLVSGSTAWAGVEPEPFRTGLFGVTAGQSIRISVVNAGTTGGIIAPCVRIWDAAATLLHEADGGLLAGGDGAFVDLQPVPDDGAPPSGAPVRGGGRLQVRAEVVFSPVPEDGVPGPACAPIPDDGVPVPEDGHPAARRSKGQALLTLEVFDSATGQTTYTMPFLAVGFNPQPEPPDPACR